MILDPIDQRIRDEGFNFVPFDRFLAERFVPKTLDMSGGISTLPILPLINPYQGSGDDRDTVTTAPPDTSGFDYETDAYGLDNLSAFEKGLTEEEQEALNEYRNPQLSKGQIAQIGFGLVTNPIGTIFNARRIRKQNEARALERAQEAAAQADFDRAMAQGQDFYDSLNEGRGATSTAESRATAGDDPGYSGPSPFADGGRAGYQEGGSIEARLEQLGGDVTSAEQMLQNINERLQSAESSLGSGGANSVTINAGMQQPTVLGGGLGGLPGLPANVGIFAGRPVDIGGVAQPINPQTTGPLNNMLEFDKEADFDKDPYKNTLLGGLSQDGQRFDSAQSAFDALAEQTRKYREVSPFTRDMVGTEQFQGEEGFKRFTDMFNEINDPSYVAPSPQLLSAGPRLTGGGQGVMGGSRSPLQTALGFADGGIADMLDIYD